MLIPLGDLKFFYNRVLPYLGYEGRVYIVKSEYKGVYPDIWVDMSSSVPVISVTKEWRRQSVSERRKRLIHESCHLVGMKHGRIDSLMYSTYPDKDSFSRWLYQRIRRVK